MSAGLHQRAYSGGTLATRRNYRHGFDRLGIRNGACVEMKLAIASRAGVIVVVYGEDEFTRAASPMMDSTLGMRGFY